MVAVLMHHYDYSLQEAVNHVGAMCREVMDTFAKNKTLIPSFGEETLDSHVAKYVEGLQDWISGALHWSFKSQRYLGAEGPEIKKHRWVNLMPKEGSNVIEGEATFLETMESSIPTGIVVQD